MTINEKIIQFIDTKGISQRKFTTDTGLTEGLLRRGKNIGADKLINIRNIFPELNMNWLLFEEGNMLLDEFQIASEPIVHYKKENNTIEQKVLLEIRKINGQITELKCEIELLKMGNEINSELKDS